MFVILLKSCLGCNALSITIRSKRPTEDEIKELIHTLGGMHCISHQIRKIELDGHPEEFELGYYD